MQTVFAANVRLNGCILVCSPRCGENVGGWGCLAAAGRKPVWYRAGTRQHPPAHAKRLHPAHIARLICAIKIIAAPVECALTYQMTLLFTGEAFSLSSTARLTAATVLRKHNMTTKQTLAQLKAMGCKATYCKDWNEYRVTLPNLEPKREEAIAYYTSDAEDALHTGAAMKGLN